MKPRGVKVITEMAEKEVTFLTDVDAMFVSLVKHAANQMPFRVIKSDDAEVEPAQTPINKDYSSLDDATIDRLVDYIIKGGEGSGNWGHRGKIGQWGGSAPSDQAQTAFSQFLKQEGASISMRGNPPKTGYMVSPYKERETRIRLPKDRSKIDRSALVERFKKFREDNKDVLTKKGHYFGAWVSKGILYLDVSVNESDVSVARRLGKRHNQLKIWDVKNSKEVDV